MAKTILHIIVAVAIWFSFSFFGVHWGFRIGTILVGAILVHWFWERYLSNPYLYLGAIPIANDDPLMQAAREKSAATFDKFLEIHPDHKSDSLVRFRFETDTGTIEHLWGDLLEIDEQKAKIFLRTPPIEHEGQLERTMTIDREQINDWQVEFRDGTLRGGYTNLANFKIYEREEGMLHPKLVEQFQRFKEIDW